MIDAAVEWAGAAGPPNWVFALALLTHPKVWSEAGVRLVRSRVLDEAVKKEEKGKEESADE